MDWQGLLYIILLPLLGGYLVGSIPFGLILCQLCGHGDIRTIGSGNIGATNVLRTGNKTLALLTLILDIGKGAILILVFFSGFPSPASDQFVLNPNITHMVALILGLGTILGHCFPVWLKFKGGKGVATTLGVLIAATPWTGFVAVCTWLMTAAMFRYSSLAALVAMGIAPLATLLIYGPAPAVANLLITALVFWRHKQNIQRLIKGEESKINLKKQE